MTTWADFERVICAGKAHCRACRTGAPFRATILAKGLVTERDFECPSGYTATNLPIRGLGDLVERLVKPLAKALKLPCLDSTGQLKPKSECAKRRDRLNRLAIP